MIQTSFFPDLASFETLLRTQAVPMRRAAMAQLRSPSEVDDVLQDMWLAAYRAWPSYRGEGAPTAWLRTILRRQIIDHRRRRRPTTDLSTATELAAGGPSAEAVIAARQSLARLSTNSGQLRGRDRMLLERCLVDGSSPTTVARDLGASPVTICGRARPAPRAAGGCRLDPTGPRRS